MAHDSDPSEDGATGVRGVGRELADAVRRDWRGVLVAAIGALLGLLLADVLGDSQDARTLAAVAGAAGATWFKGISDRLRWRERTLAATAGVLGAVAMPSARRYVLEAARSAATTGAPTTSAATTIAVTAIGAAAVVVGDLVS